MKTQNRPELKVGDRVRFRSDGEIGELNRCQNLNTEIFHTVKKICKDGMVYHEGGGSYAQVQFDICNDFSDVQVGDKVEMYNSKHGITTETVASVSENEFKLEICKTIGCKLSISKADGIHCNFPDGGWYVLRIVEKAKPKPLLADAKVGDIAAVETKHGNIVYKPIFHVTDDYVYAGENGKINVGYKYRKIDGTNELDNRFKIVSFEPLAPEGSAEWAWQMLNLLGLPIYHPAEGVLTIPVPYSSERFAHCYAKTGWQIHEPEPKPATQNEPIDTSVTGLTVTIGNALYTLAGRNGEPSSSHYESIEEWIKTSIDSMQKQHKPEPKFNVGDWVEHKKSKEQGRITYISSDNYDTIEVKLYDQDELETYTKSDFNADFRKLKHSEVVVDFGNGVKGTVRSCEYDSGCVRVIYGDRVIAHIVTDILEQPMRELVESLLKAQEEK